MTALTFRRESGFQSAARLTRGHVPLLGADESDDVFAGYTFTLESGFPDKAIEVVLYSIAPLDGYVGQMRPFVDGGSTA